jgi:hypothetical protein
MFTKSKITQSMIDAVKSVVSEENKKLLLEPGKSEKVPTPTGMKVYGHRYGDSAKARKDQTSHDIDKIKGPKDKEMKEAAKPDFLDMDKDGNKKESMKKAIADKNMKEELKGNQDKIDANHNNKIDAQDFAILRGKKKVKEGREFTEKLLNSINEKKDVVMPEDSSPAKNTDVADKSYLKDMGKKPTVKSDLKNLGRFLTGKKETNEEVEQIEEKEGYSAKAARAGKDIGKPGKEFSKIAKSAGERYGSAEAGKRVAGAILAKLRKEEVENYIESLDEEMADIELNEVLGKDATAGDWIHDFVHSDNPKFAGKSKAERKKMALGAYYGKQNEAYKDPDAEAITTDTLAGRMPGGKFNSFKSYKLRVNPSDKEGDGSVRRPDCAEPEKTAARASIHAEEVQVEATIAGTSGWEKIKDTDTKGNVKDKSGAVHTPMSRARDLARQAFKKVQDKTKIKTETMMGKAGTTSESKKKW